LGLFHHHSANLAGLDRTKAAPTDTKESTVEFRESDEIQMLREAVSAIASKFGHDYYAEKARADERTDELWNAIGEAGFLGVNVPEEYGGGGGGITELAIVAEELAAAGCPLLVIVVSPAICATIIAMFGTEAQKQRWLPRFATGELKMAFAITEPDAGSNSHNLSLTATKDGDIWRLNGQKYYISGVDECEAVMVVTRSGVDPDTGRGRLSLFVVDTDTPGFEKQVLPVEITAPEKQFTLFFDNVEIEADRMIGDEGEGLRQVFYGLNPERILSAATANGISRYALDKAAAYATTREVWGTPIARHQGISHPLAKAKIEVELARTMTDKASWYCDNDGDSALAGETANMAKFAAAEAALVALDQAIQTHGGNGMSTEYGLADLWGMARLLRIAPVSREMILNYVAQHSLRLPRSY
jgi:alkylation response protein AidB-like acyl-CoA dehydrogenase